MGVFVMMTVTVSVFVMMQRMAVMAGDGVDDDVYDRMNG